MPRRFFCLTLIAALAATAAMPLQAQYFGRNKVHYEQSDFRVLETPHFRVHFHPEAEAPRWEWHGWRALEHPYQRNVQSSAYEKNPILLSQTIRRYQTNAVWETGGRTGGAQSRFVTAIMPLTRVYEDNDKSSDTKGARSSTTSPAPRNVRSVGMSNFAVVIRGSGLYLSLGRAELHGDVDA